MKNCQDRVEDISADIDGELSAEEKAELDAHLAECSECRALRDELAAMQQAFPLTNLTPPDTLTPGILYKTTVETTESPWRRRITALISVAACVALLLWIGQNNNFLSPVETDAYYAGGEAPASENNGADGAGDVAPEADIGADTVPKAYDTAKDDSTVSPPGNEPNAFSSAASSDDAAEAPNANPASEPAYLARYADANDTEQTVRYVIVVEEPDVLCEAHASDLSEELSDGSYLIPLEVFESWIGEGRIRTENEPIVIDPTSIDVLVIADR